LTASGILFCLLAIEATYAEDFQMAFALLLAAVLIDAIDGTFARLVHIKSVLPNFNGELLDNIIDYVSFVLVPALIIHRAGLLPEATSFATISIVAIASAYQFCQEDAKTEDHFFKGFPSYWNIVALYLLAMKLNAWLNFTILIAFSILVFVPIKYVYISRTPTLQRTTLVLSTAWTIAMLVILYQLPDVDPNWIAGSMIFVLYYVGISLWLTVRTRRLSTHQ